jgi:hypothetical protein
MKDEWKGARCQIKIEKYMKFEALTPLVPQNNLVAHNEIIPGL